MEENRAPKLKSSKSKEEVEYKNKSGTAWSHSYLNQKPWHPLSYVNQRRKWIAEQTHAERQRKDEEVAREFSQQQEFLKQTAALSKKEKEKAEAIQALSFMYTRPPGYNAESARAAEIADERRQQVDSNGSALDTAAEGPSNSGDEKRPAENKQRVKDIYGRPLPTEEEFPSLKNAPRLDTGAPARVKPFAIEIRNVKCARCGAFGHQSGDRECSMKDALTPNEEARLRRNDPLNIMMAHSVPDSAQKWELKQQPGGLSPPRGGFRPEDPNQQIIPEDIYDEYGGFLASMDGDGFSDIIASFGKKHMKKQKRKKKEKHEHVKEISRKQKKKRRKKENSEEASSASHDSGDSSTSSDNNHVQKKKKGKERHRSSHNTDKKHHRKESYLERRCI